MGTGGTPVYEDAVGPRLFDFITVGSSLFVISDTDLRLKSIDYRKRILKVIKQAKGGHTGGKPLLH